MVQILLSGLGIRRCVEVSKDETIRNLKHRIYNLEGIEPEHIRLTSGTRNLKDDDCVEGDFSLVNINLRLLGGKGGFGALLRGAGTKAGQKKNNNTDDCRDLNGRRMKDVKAEKELLDWFIAQKKEKREKEHEKKLKEAAAATARARREEPVARFEDPEYVKQLREAEDAISSSIEQGLKAAMQKKKNPVPDVSNTKKRKTMMWDDSDDSDSETQPKKSGKEEEEVKTITTTMTTTTTTTITKTETFVHKKEESEASIEANRIPEKEEIPEVDLDEFNSAVDLEALGLEKLREQLQLRGLKIGGSLKDRASRLFSVKGKSKDEIDPKLFANAAVSNKKKNK